MWGYNYMYCVKFRLCFPQYKPASDSHPSYHLSQRGSSCVRLDTFNIFTYYSKANLIVESRAPCCHVPTCRVSNLCVIVIVYNAFDCVD